MDEKQVIFLTVSDVKCPKCNTEYKKEDLFESYNDEAECSVCRFKAKFTDDNGWVYKSPL